MPENIERKDIPGWGSDLAPQRRPGVPEIQEPHRQRHAHWDEPERQEGTPSVFMSAVRERPTPVFGTAVPPKGLSGIIRRYAYTIPDHRPSHWTTLILADKVDVMEGRLGEGARSPWGKLALACAAVLAVGYAVTKT